MADKITRVKVPAKYKCVREVSVTCKTGVATITKDSAISSVYFDVDGYIEFRCNKVAYSLSCKAFFENFKRV